MKIIQILIVMTFLTLCLVCSDEESSCSAKNTSQFVKKFILSILMPLLVFRLIALIATCKSIEGATQCYQLGELYNFFAYGGFSIYGIVIMFTPIPKECFQVFEINFMNYMLILVAGLAPAISASCVCLFLVCCIPCICMYTSEMRH